MFKTLMNVRVTPVNMVEHVKMVHGASLALVPRVTRKPYAHGVRK